MDILANIAVFLTIIYTVTIIIFLAGMMFRKMGTSTSRPMVTVVIAARNEEQNIGHILGDLVNQSYPTDLYEIIIANDNSTDNTEKIVNSFAEQYPFIKCISVENIPAHYSPKKFVLQTAINMAQGEIILATDADCRVKNQWIETIVSYFEPQVGFVIGFSQYGLPGDDQNLIEQIQAFDFVQMMSVDVGTCNFGVPLAASGQNLAYRKKAFEQVGGYESIAHRVSGDDVLLLQLVRKNTDYKIVFAGDPKSYASSQPQPTLMSLINQRIRWASNAKVQLLLNIPFFFYLLEVYLFNAVSIIGLILAIILNSHISIFLGMAALKIIMEFILALRATQFFHRQDLLKYFPIWFFFQIPYVTVVGLLGTFGNFSWKGRKHAATTRS